MLSQKTATDLLGDELLPAYWAEKEKLDRIDSWLRWDHDAPHMPREADLSDEYKEINARAQTPWGALVVNTIAQALKVIGYRSIGQTNESDAWKAWKRNRMPAKQQGLHRAAAGYGQASNIVLPGVDGRGEKLPIITSLSPRNLLTFDGDIDLIDDFPAYALRMDPAMLLSQGAFSAGWESTATGWAPGWIARIYDDEAIYTFEVGASAGQGGTGGGITYITTDAHDMGVCPVARYVTTVDLEGRTDGEIEPIIPLLGRIDQTTFDRLLVQRFQSWAVRWATGMQQPETDEERRAAEIILKHGDLLVSDSVDTKFGQLTASDVGPLAEAAHNSDLRDLAAITQISAHFLLGSLNNIGAEAVAAADASLNRKLKSMQSALTVGHQTTFQLCALANGDEEGFYDYETEVKWEDPEVRSLSQAADALGKMAMMLHYPVEMLWERVPGVTEDDVERAKKITSSGDGIDQLLAKMNADLMPPPVAGPPPAPGDEPPAPPKA